jgi:hypothetical protein
MWLLAKSNTLISLQLLRSGTVLSLLDLRSKLLSLGQVVHKEEGTEEIPALSNLSISKAVVPFKLGNVDNSLASDRILPTKKDINQITAKHKAPRKSSSDVREERDEPLERTMKKQFT